MNKLEFIANAENTSIETTDNGQPLAKYTDGYDFERLQNELYEQHQVVLSNNNPIYPVLTLLQQSAGARSRVDLRIYKLKRNINGYDFTSSNSAEIRNTSFDKALEIAKKYDLNKTNPDPANITVYPAPSREEVQKQKEATKRQENEEKYSKDLEDSYNTNYDKLRKGTLTGEEKTNFCNTLIPLIDNDLSAKQRNAVNAAESKNSAAIAEFADKIPKLEQELAQAKVLCS